MCVSKRMEGKSSVTHPASLLLPLLLLLLNWMETTNCSGFTVDPPEDLVISDPGHFGHLEITWSPPASLINITDCTKLYQLEYFDAYRNRWRAIRTPLRSYSAQFDLMKDVRVRVYTLLSGPYTNGTTIMSTNYTELVQKPSSTGIVGTTVKDFTCVFYNMENIECKWGINPKMPAKSLQNLYFWHKNLEQAEECPKYIVSGGVRSGCDFTGKPLPDFTDINFYINGSSPAGPLQPTFISLQIQNYVKPRAAEKLHLQTRPDMQLEIQWEHPTGRVPEHCLEWEVELRHEDPDGKIALMRYFTKQTSFSLPLSHNYKRNCVSVRSKLDKYCVDTGIWSEWSRPTCHPEVTEVVPEPQWDTIPVYVYVAAAIITILVLSLCVGTVLRVKRSRQVKKPDTLLTTLFA